MSAHKKFTELAHRHTPAEGSYETPIQGLRLLRADAPTMPMPVVYAPTLCLVAQGKKRAVLGDTAYVYDAGNYLLASVNLPVVGSVITASPALPFLCLQLDLDRAVLADLALELQHATAASESLSPGLSLNETSTGMLDAASRLLGLLDTPRDIPALAPLIIREILYRLLTGPDARVVKQMAQADSRLNQISRAIAWIRIHFDQACRIDEIAAVAGMSRSSLHVHFKTVTAMSPLEFRTRLRLQEARRLMVADALDAAQAGFRVGYESPSQFSRDYVRLFGAPPATDAGRLRDGVGA
jgi:AraC-like DNA-binding protein